MIPRQTAESLVETLGRFPAVALLGPRQAGKTTLALAVEPAIGKPVTYLDLERDSDRARLEDAELYLATQRGRLVILDEVQRAPEIFPLLRSLIDERIRAGERTSQFLLLGSASPDLLRQSSESLAGRIAYLELTPFSLAEVLPIDGDAALDRLWSRGGFPPSYLARDDCASAEWRGAFVSTYLERDLAQLAPRLPAERMRRFWTMLAHGQGEPWNASKLAAALGVSGNTVRTYLDVLTDLYMVRQLAPWAGNSRKRLVRSPKVYVRDSGIAHRLAGIPDLETLLGHPLLGRSFEGFAIEQLVCGLSSDWHATYYRTSAQTEIDLVLEGPRHRVIAIEIKRSSAPAVGRGFSDACDEVGASERYAVVPRGTAYPTREFEVLPLAQAVARLRG